MFALIAVFVFCFFRAQQWRQQIKEKYIVQLTPFKEWNHFKSQHMNWIFIM